MKLRHHRNGHTDEQDATDDTGLAAVVGPAAVEIAPGHLRIGDGYAATLIVNGYPAEVGPAWLEPLLCWPGRLDVAMHIEPLAPQVAAARLRRQRARLESSRRLDADKGRLDDPDVEAAADDAAHLADKVARGAARLFRVGLYLTVHAATLDELVDAVAHVRATAASVMLDTVPATWRQLQAWSSTLPLGVDSLGVRRVFDTDSLAAAIPLASSDLPAPLPGDPPQTSGVLYGLNTATNGVVWHDRWAADNHNSVILAAGLREDPRRLVVVDEAWMLLRDGDGAKFLYRMAKAARKRRAGLSVVTQDAADLLASDLGQAVVANSATQILMRQAPQAIEAIAAAFALTTGEARLLLSARRGEGLMLCGTSRVAFQAVSSTYEHKLAAGDREAGES